MATTAAQLIAEVSVTGADKAKADLQGVSDTTNATGATFKSALGNALSLTSGVAGQALGFLKDQLVSSVKDAMDHQVVMTQTAQAIKSTGDASGMTSKSISNLADSLSKATDFSEETVQSGENLMLTFTGIGKEVFPQATTAMLDLSQATGQDMKSSALQLGKALNDPLTGLTALSRVGVSFSDAEKISIQTMMKHNDVAGAQAVMLKELNTEFGGSAKAAGQTFAGQLQILNNTFEDLKVKIGTAILPVLSSLSGLVTSLVMPALDKFSAWFSATAGPALQKFGDFLSASVVPALQHLASNAQIMVPILAGLGAVILTILVPATWSWAAGVIAATWPFLAIGVAVAAATAIFLHFYQSNAGFKSFIDAIGHAIGGLGPMFSQIGSILMSSLAPAWQQLQQAIKPAIPALQMIGEILGGVLVVAIGLVVGLITGLAKGIAQAMSGIVTIISGVVLVFAGAFNVIAGLVSFFVDLFTGKWDKLGGDLQRIVGGYVEMFRGMFTVMGGIFQTAFGFLSGLVSGFVQGIETFFKGLFESLVGHSIVPDMINGIVSWFAQLPGRAMSFVSSLVSQITGALGGLGGLALTWAKDMMTNFVQGIEQGITDIGNAAANIGSTISAHLHFSKPDTGPLADADTWMPDMMSMLAQGMNANLGKIKSASLSVATSISTGASSPLAGGVQAIPHSVSQSGPIQIIVQSPDVNLDGRLLARGMMPHIVQSVRSVTGVKY